MEINITEIIIAAVTLAFGILSTVIIPRVFKLIDAKNENAAVQAAKASIETIVASLQQTVVEGLKERSTDGKLTMDEAKEVAQAATHDFFSEASDQTLKILTERKGDITAYIGKLIDEAVLKLKK